MDFYRSQLQSLQSTGNLREIPEDTTGQPGIVDFSTNDYLGIAADISLQEEFMADTGHRMIPFTSSASRLLSSRQKEYTALEGFLSELYGRKVLLFNSGYHANTGLVSALASAPRTLIVADKLVHASIIDGIVLSKADFERFRHNDYDHLQRILEKKASGYDRVLIIVESVYSMDGDRADISRLAALRRRYSNSMLYVDEAHAFGVLGPGGLGLVMAASEEDRGCVDVLVGTLGKAAASSGAFAVVGDEIYDWAVNRARSLIFSTALPPIVCEWSRYVIERMLTMDSRRAHLMELTAILNDDGRYIYPHIVGEAKATVELSQRLLKEGLKVLPIRVPTVPPGTERLRISLSAAMTTDEVRRLATALAK